MYMKKKESNLHFKFLEWKTKRFSLSFSIHHKEKIQSLPPFGYLSNNRFSIKEGEDQNQNNIGLIHFEFYFCIKAFSVVATTYINLNILYLFTYMMFQRFSFGNQLNFKSKETLKPNANANFISLKRSHTNKIQESKERRRMIWKIWNYYQQHHHYIEI